MRSQPGRARSRGGRQAPFPTALVGADGELPAGPDERQAQQGRVREQPLERFLIIQPHVRETAVAVGA